MKMWKDRDGEDMLLLQPYGGTEVGGPRGFDDWYMYNMAGFAPLDVAGSQGQYG